MKKLVIMLVFLFLFLSKADSVSADISVANASAQLKSREVLEGKDERIKILEKFLAKHNSPLTPYSKDFIEAADKYGLDWRFVPAITGVESTFGKRIPFNSYNAYGWANGAYRFSSWDESIEVVSKTLREKYLDRGARSINQIARRYAPPSSTWAGKVRFFMDKIEPFPVEFAFEG